MSRSSAPAYAARLADRSLAAARRRRRWLFHGSALVAFGVTFAAVLVWPQWLALDSARAALQSQLAKERSLESRLAAARDGRSAAAPGGERRFLLPAEAARLAETVRATARARGATATRVQVTEHADPHWLAAADAASLAGECELAPRTVRLVLEGDFAGIYSTVAALCSGVRLFVPGEWAVAAAGSGPDGRIRLRAVVRGTVFVVEEPSTEPQRAPEAEPELPAPRAARMAQETRG